MIMVTAFIINHYYYIHILEDNCVINNVDQFPDMD